MINYFYLIPSKNIDSKSLSLILTAHFPSKSNIPFHKLGVTTQKNQGRAKGVEIFNLRSLDLGYQQLIMSAAECVFKSFEGAGSIFVSHSRQLTPQLFKDHTCRAVILINGSRLSKTQHAAILNLRQFPVTVSSGCINMTPLFHSVSLFISEARKTTNIMVWCPSNGELAAVFAFAHLIIKYGYTIEYLWRIYDKRITYVAISEEFVLKLKLLNPKEDEAVRKLKDSRVEKRMLRIKESYVELRKESCAYQTSVSKLHRRSESNPEKSIQKGHSQDDVVIQALQNEPWSPIRLKSTMSTKPPAHRNIFKSFDYVF